MESDIVETITDWCEFGKNRAYILMCFSRRKFNPDITNSQEIIHRRVLTAEDQVEDQLADLYALMNRHELHFRLYLTVNARDTVSTYYGFIQEMMDRSEQLYNGDDGAHTVIERMGSEWKSTLHKEAHKDDQYFHFDLDDVTNSEAMRFKNQCNDVSDVVGQFQSPNGWHVITEPFNYTTWTPIVEYDEMDTDGMIHIDEIDNRVDT